MSLVGRTVGRYRITEKLGEGGMGVVYRAQDATLGRHVAIKLLRAEVGQHPERVRRFAQEARAASALNHPNIITVHDAGDFEGGLFLVMELVEGESLRTQLRRGALPLAKVLDIGIQAAAALTRAHAAGITHRDLKPENILVRSDGYVKVLDFGLAKLKEQEVSEEATTATIETALTSEGTVVGTAAYMSPEQSTGRSVDGRSDIFSLALALLECWQGRHPFLRSNSLDTRHAIAHDRLPALDYAAGTPEWGLARMLEKALEKEPDERYQTIKDLGIDLRRLKQDSESGKLPSSAAPAPARPRSKLLYVLAGLALLMLMAGGSWRVFHSQEPGAPARQGYTQLTNFADSAVSPVLSPDGRMLAFIRGERTFGGPGQLYVKLLPDGEPMQLTHIDPKIMISRPQFSPDGAQIAYGIMENWATDTWVVPVLGGQPRLFLGNSSGLTWVEAEAGQRRVMYSVLTGKGAQMGIFTSTESRAQPHTIYMPRAEDAGMAHYSHLSPDRKWILVAEMDANSWLPCRLMPFDGSNSGKPVGPAPAQCTDAAWSPDGKWMYFTANAGNGYHIWRQSFPGGRPEQVTAGATQEEGVAFSSVDGHSFVTSIGQSQSTLWFHDSRGDRQITSEGFAIYPTLSFDGKKLYYLLRAGGARSWVSGELWVADLESGQRQRLLPDFLLQHYTVSRDGRRVVFVAADDAGRSPVWIAALEGGSAPRQLVAGGGIQTFFAVDDDVVYVARDKETISLYHVKGDGSELPKPAPPPLFRGRPLDFTGGIPAVSSDGKWVVVQGGIEKGWGAVVVYPIDGGTPTLLCGACAEPPDLEPGNTILSANWTPDGKFLYLNFQGSVYAIPLRPGQALPPVPESGFRTAKEVAALPGARVIREPRAVTGPDPLVYAYQRFSTQRNIYRVPVP